MTMEKQISSVVRLSSLFVRVSTKSVFATVWILQKPWFTPLCQHGQTTTTHSILDCLRSRLRGSKTYRILLPALFNIDTGKYEHNLHPPLLREPLLAPSRPPPCIVYKLLLIAYNSLYGLTPAYIKRISLTAKPKRDLQSDDTMLLLVARSNMMSYSKKIFSHAIY